MRIAIRLKFAKVIGSRGIDPFSPALTLLPMYTVLRAYGLQVIC